MEGRRSYGYRERKTHIHNKVGIQARSFFKGPFSFLSNSSVPQSFSYLIMAVTAKLWATCIVYLFFTYIDIRSVVFFRRRLVRQTQHNTTLNRSFFVVSFIYFTGTGTGINTGTLAIIKFCPRDEAQEMKRKLYCTGGSSACSRKATGSKAIVQHSSSISIPSIVSSVTTLSEKPARKHRDSVEKYRRSR